MTPSDAISTPCRDICRIEMATGVCAGCGRTGAEIQAWPAMSEPERLAIMARLQAEWRPVREPQRQYFDAPWPRPPR
jgi:predicted Fe-S protein YdhL (DUF1289 family)